MLELIMPLISIELFAITGIERIILAKWVSYRTDFLIKDGISYNNALKTISLLDTHLVTISIS